MLRLAAVFVALAAIASATTPINKCKVGELPKYLDIPGCTSLPCKFIRGTTITGDIDFVVDHKVSKLTSKVRATALGVTTDYPLPDSNACNSITNSECPLSKGEEVIYHMELPVLKVYPKVTVDVELSLYDQDNKVVACFSFTGKVTDS